MALPVLERLALRGDETVLDAGCGSGRVTELLLDRVPRGRVIAVDASPSMIAQAARRLDRFGGQVRLLLADLQRPLPVDTPVDAVLSTATFHWIKDHAALFFNLATALQPGGQLVFQCGGEGNIASVVEVLRAVGDGWQGPWNFAGTAETRRRLEAAGFDQIRCWLSPEPVTVAPGEPLETYLATVVLGAHLDRLPVAERAAFVKEVATRLPTPALDYVRLNVVARRG